MNIRPVTREEFVMAMAAMDPKMDRFAHTFVSKCDMLGAWDRTFGVWTAQNKLAGALTLTLSKRLPCVANLQLLHVFSEFRRHGLGKVLCAHAVHRAHTAGAQYLRVSAEPEALEFYRRIGFKFWGRQKKCYLSMFQLTGPELKDAVYPTNDPVIHSALFSGRKGSLVESYGEAR